MPEERKQLPVTLISGFLGAGKSTLLRNILEAKKTDGSEFRCAVLVNDMAELNIDKSLIESSGLVRSDEVISMQNGCVCCNLSGDLIEQIVKLTMNKETPFDYLIIEASGVSEPAAIAALFEECEEDHDHGEHAHNAATTLSSVARMDTIVTVVDSAEFLQNLDLMDDPSKKNFPRLLVDQVEYSNVVLLNKTDLVNESQLQEVKDKVALLVGSETKILKTENSTIDVKEVVDTKLYNSKDFDLSKFIQAFETLQVKSCCKASVAKGESPCCKRARTIDSGKSQVLLPSKKLTKTRHGENYDITSFVYKARRPFTPQHLYENFIDKFFMSEEDPEEDEEDEEMDEDGMEEEKTGDDEEAEADAEPSPPEKKKSKLEGGEEQKSDDEYETEELLAAIQKMQEEGAKRKKVRTETIGSLLRMKGYLWQGNSHDLIGYISTAGNLSRIESPGRWACLEESSWKGTSETEEKRTKIREQWVAPYGDRRQELVFIGQNLKHEKIQKILDDCLVSDESMALGVDSWKATFGDIMLDS